MRAAAAAAGREMRARLKSGPESARTAFFSRNRRRFFSLARGLFSGCGAAELCVMERERGWEGISGGLVRGLTVCGRDEAGLFWCGLMRC